MLSSQSASQGAVTLHNGYLQALLDSGAIGAALYVAVILSALGCFLFYDRDKRYASEFYGLLFLAIANLGETVIFGAAVLHGVWFWYLSVLALTLALARPSIPLSEDRACGKQADDILEPDSHIPAYPSTRRRFPLVQSKEAWS